MVASPRMLVLLLVTLHLQPHYSKYYLVETDGKAASVHRNHKENIKHQSSSKTSKVKPGSARNMDKKTGKVRRKHIGVDYVENQPNPNPGILPDPNPILPSRPQIPGTFLPGSKKQGTVPPGPKGQGTFSPGEL